MRSGTGCIRRALNFASGAMSSVLSTTSPAWLHRPIIPTTLQRYVQAHWIEEGNKIFKPPVVSDGDKAALRDRILGELAPSARSRNRTF